MAGGERRTEGFSRFGDKNRAKQKLSKTKTEGEVKITRLLLGHSFINTLNEETKLVANNHPDIVLGARDILELHLNPMLDRSLYIFYFVAQEKV